MAYSKAFYNEFKSMNGERIRIEIMVKSWLSLSYRMDLGGSGPEISYGASGDEKFTPILTSKLTLPFLVTYPVHEQFIQKCRTEYEEGDVYINVYPWTSTTPLWSGFVLMDLSSIEDVSMPYEVKLTAVDGLGLLKEIDFVPDPSEDSPYEVNDTYIPNQFGRITDWIMLVLEQTKMASTADNRASSDWRFNSSVEWFNQKHLDDEINPLYDTRWKALPWYKVVDEDSSPLKYEAFSCYEVLESICKTWGMRCLYWNHNFWFVQIGFYDTHESGTFASPDNIRTFGYTMAGVSVGVRPYIGTSWYSRYSLRIENVTSPGTGLQKLAGGKWDNYPRVKKVIIDFQTLGDYNFYTGFPPLGGPYVSPAVDFLTTSTLGVFTDADGVGGFYSQIYLQINNLDSISHNFKFNWGIRAREAGTTPFTKMLDNTGGVLSWVAYAAPTLPQPTNPPLPFNYNVLLTPGSHIFNISSFSVGAGIIPTDPAFIGDWELEIYALGGVIVAIFDYPAGHGVLDEYPAPLLGYLVGDSPDGVVTYSDVPGQSFFCTFSSGVVGPASTHVSFTSPGDDTYTIDVGKIYFGDVLDTASPSALQVWTGTAWEFTNFTGEWAKGTGAGGSSSLVELLAKEIASCQNIDSYKLMCGVVLAQKDKRETDSSGSRDKYVNPLTRLMDTDGKLYIMLNAKFNMLRDEWEGMWFQFTHDNIGGGNSASSPMIGPFTGSVTSAGTYDEASKSGKLLGTSMVVPKHAHTFTQITAQYDTSASPITSIAIQDIRATLLKTDDVLEIYDFKSGYRHEITLSADQTDGDETLSIDSFDFDIIINEGSLVQMSQQDATQQYQRKTRGTVGGITVTATELGPLHSDGTIDGVDTEYIKLIPSDFMANTGGGTTKSLQFNDAGTTGVKPTNSGIILWAFAIIPNRKKATSITVWGNGTKTINVYEMELDGSGIGSIISTGTMGSAFDIDPNITASDSNMVAVSVGTDATANRVYGGKITIQDA